MRRHLRLNEHKVLLYRLLLAYGFYSVARVLFYLYNSRLLRVESLSEFLALAYHGLMFDTTAILYVNVLFVLVSLLPTSRNTTSAYQKYLRCLYFGTNLPAFATN